MPDPEARSFDRETFRFLAELAAHNERAWFEANKQRYWDYCMEPAVAFIRAMAPAIASISPHLAASARRMGGSLMRIHRDTRFARDKSPYKINIGIQFRHERGRDVHAPGLYVHIVPGSCFLGAGIWHPDPKALRAIRTEIVEQPALWERARNDKAFRRHFELGGAQAERPPRGFPAGGPHAADIKRKDFIAVCEIADDEVTRGDFERRSAERFASARPLLAFLCGALDLPF